MKTKKLFLVPALIAVLDLLSIGRASAQTFTTVHNFSGGPGDDSPYAGLLLSGNKLYGTTLGSYGRVFAVGTDGTGFTNLHSIHGSTAGLIISGKTLYGTVPGIDGGPGYVFAVDIDGTGSTNLHLFQPTSNYAPFVNAGGADPRGELVLVGNTLYGTTYNGGPWGGGNIFTVSTNGTGFTVLYAGGRSDAGLIFSDGTLYGTQTYGGVGRAGMVFAAKTNRTDFEASALHTFARTDVTNNTGGAEPAGGLILAGDTLYGTAKAGGIGGAGTVYAVNRNGTGFRVLHSFPALSDVYSGTNSDGANPEAGLILSGNTLYGTAKNGGRSGSGTVFAINTNGTGFMNLHSFNGGSDGGNPWGELVLSGNTLYGTAPWGGSSNQGTIFSLSFDPQLTLIRSGTSIILSWPTNVGGFDSTGYKLQSTPSLVSPTVWSTNSSAPVVMAGRNTITNPIAGGQKFYRLAQ